MWFVRNIGPSTCCGELTCVGTDVNGIGELGSFKVTGGERCAVPAHLMFWTVHLSCFFVRLHFPLALRMLTFKISGAIENEKGQGFVYTKNVKLQCTEVSKKSNCIQEEI